MKTLSTVPTAILPHLPSCGSPCSYGEKSEIMCDLEVRYQTPGTYYPSHPRAHPLLLSQLYPPYLVYQHVRLLLQCTTDLIH